MEEWPLGYQVLGSPTDWLEVGWSVGWSVVGWSVGRLFDSDGLYVRRGYRTNSQSENKKFYRRSIVGVEGREILMH